MKTIYKMCLIFLVLTGAVTLLINFTTVPFGTIDFFKNHGWFFLFFITFFPRLTLFISGLFFHSIEFGGFLWWIGFFIAPRFLVALLATFSYWMTNPLLVVIAWGVALGGESSEKVFITNRLRPTQKFHQYAGTTIDAEFKVKD